MLCYVRYNYTLSCSLKFVQHLKHFEHLVSVLGQATEVLVRDFSCNAMVMELVREISRIDPRELGGNYFLNYVWIIIFLVSSRHQRHPELFFVPGGACREAS